VHIPVEAVGSIDICSFVRKNARMSQIESLENTLAQIDSDFVKALAEPVRIEILKYLVLAGPSDVNSLAEKMPQDRSVISRHLSIMKSAGLLNMRKEGRHVIYSVDGDSALQKSEKIVETIKQCLKLGCC